MPSVQFNVRIERSMLAAAKSEAERQGMPVAEFVRQSIVFRLGYLAGLEDAAQTAHADRTRNPGTQ